jgi:membrane-associated phospholipid phosphatase
MAHAFQHLSVNQRRALVGAFMVLGYGLNALVNLGFLGGPKKADFRPTDTTISGRENGESVPTMLLIVLSGVGFPALIAAVVKLHGGSNRAVLNFVIVALHVLGMNTLLTMVMKLSFSRLRPTFLTACAPDATDLANGVNSVGGGWFSQEACSDQDINHYRRSFPSGHASSSSAAAFIFVIMMDRLKSVMPGMMGFLVRSTLSVMALCFAGYVAGGRFFERHHHLSDVVAGAVVGGLTAFLVFRQSPLSAPGNVLQPRDSSVESSDEYGDGDVENGVVTVLQK